MTPTAHDDVPAVLAIDGGNSKTDLALVSAEGAVLVAMRGPGSGAPTADSLAPMVEQIAAAAGIHPGRPVAAHLSACLAGVDLPEQEEALGAAVAARGWTASTRVLNDTFALLRSGIQRPWGVAVVCGAGMNCVGVAPDGRSARFLALGHSSGDWGGGLWLGNEIVGAAVRAEDGRGPATALSVLVARHFGRATAHEVSLAGHVGALGEEPFVSLTPLLFEAAREADPVAIALVERQADEVFLMARTIIDRLGLAGDVEVVLGGGILASGDPLLTVPVEMRLKEHSPSAVPRYPEIPPIAGAALLGLDHLGVPERAHAHLRAAYS